MSGRLLYVVGQLRSGGLERQLFYLLKEMPRDKYHPVVSVWNYDEAHPYVSRLGELEIPVIPLSKESESSSAVKLISLWKLVRELQPDIVHSFSFFTNLPVWLCTRGTTALPVGSVRSSFTREKKLVGPLRGRLSALLPRFQIFNSVSARENALRENSFFRPKNIKVIRNAVDLQKFRISAIPKSSVPTILGIGSLHSVKRWDRLITAGAELARRGLAFRIVIVGEGPMLESLVQLSNELGIADKVSFQGYEKGVEEIIPESYLLAHTSDVEGCPNVVMEAMACGRAVVAMTAGDIPLIIDDGKNGFVVPCGDVKMFVECLSRLILNPDLCSKMGSTGGEKAHQHFGLNSYVENMMNGYCLAGWSG